MALFPLPGSARCSAARRAKTALEVLHAERETLAERYATLSFDVQKPNVRTRLSSRFIGTHPAVAFDADPEAEIRGLNARRWRNRTRAEQSRSAEPAAASAVRSGQRGFPRSTA
ncbi:hypothetical protein M8494_16205 [Serratia ureilytica]